MGRHRSALAIVLALLTTFPAATLGSARDVPALPADALVHVDGNGDAGVECPGRARLALPASPVLSRAAFTVVALEGATGAVRVGGVEVATADPAVPLYVVLRGDEARTVALECVAGGVVDVRFLDAPIVEIVELPARVVSLTFTRFGLRTLGMDNALDLYVGVPTQGNVTVLAQAEGSPLPSFLQALGEDANATRTGLATLGSRFLADPPTKNEAARALSRIALVCGAIEEGFTFDGSTLCTIDALASVLTRYGIPVAAAERLLARLGRDPACGPFATTGEALATVDGVVLGELTPPLACAWGWADETAERELALPPGAIVNATARELGLDGFGTDGPCGDPGLRALPAWSPQVEPFAAVYGNRTLASRQLECAELLVASLRPLRYSWGTSRLVTRMGSAWYGETTLTLAASEPGEARLTLASQGPTLLDVTIDHEMLPASVGDALAPLRPSLAALGAPDDAEAAAALDALLAPVVEPSFAWLPSVAAARAQVLATPTSPAAAIHAARAAEDAANRTLPAAWAATPSPACGIDLVRPWLAPRCLAPLPPATLAPAAPLEAWRGRAPEAAWLAYDPSAPTSVIGAFLGAPGAPLAPADALALAFEHPAQGLIRNGASTIFPVFHPTALHVQTKDATIPRAPGVDPDVTALAEFADVRYRDLVRELEARSLARSEPPQPTRAVLVGETVWMRLLDGELTEQRRVAGTVRVIDLEQAFALPSGLDDFSIETDADLDGLSNALEAEYAAWAKPFDGTAWANVTWLALDPTNPDSDGDGMSDGWEYAQCERPALFDCGEGLSPWWPDANGDADGDYLANGDEHALSAAALSACIAENGARCLADALEARRTEACATPLALAAWSEDDGDPFAIDGDCDGLWDGYERIVGLDATADDTLAAMEDPDGDGATTRAEFEHLARVAEEHRDDGLAFPAAARAAAAEHFVDPRAFDTEGDGLPDSYEMIRGLHPRENGTWSLPRLLEPLQDDAHGNPDGDRYPNLPGGDHLETVEELVWTLARIARDEPRLSFADVVVAAATRGLDPFHRDTDRDDKDDAFEVAHENLPDVPAGCSDPIEPSFDCDADGIRDATELAIAGVPGYALSDWACLLAPSSLAAPSRLAWTRADSDADGIPDGFECWLGLDPTDPADAALDPDADGLTSLAEHKATLALHPDHAEDAAWFAPGAPGHAQSLVPRALGAFAARAADRDADGIADTFELALGLEVLRADANEDLDRDNLTNADELRWTRRGSLAPSAIGATLVANGAKDRALLEALRALAPSPADPDSDDDGAADGWEARLDFDMHPADPTDAALDADADGATAAEEFAAYAARYAAHVALAGTGWFRGHPEALLSPRIADRDGDLLLDGYELAHAARQGCAATTLYANGTGAWAKCFDAWTRADAEDDFDVDGLTNVEEHEGWSVTILRIKSDDPRLSPIRETIVGRATPDPLRSDSSGGGIVDNAKAPHARAGCTDEGSSLDPASLDTDGDGITDYVERWQWTAVQGLPEDIDGDCFVNAADADSDGDSYAWNGTFAIELTDGEEVKLRLSDPTIADTDSDGLPDGREIFHWQAELRDVAAEDVDGDGLSPLRDWDSDGDLISDAYEFETGLAPWEWKAEDTDTDGDGLTDLCEYRLRVRGDLAPCPGEPAASSPEADGIISILCAHAGFVDCDGDAIRDGFEYVNRPHPKGGFAGCDYTTWSPHTTSQGLDPCAAAYVAQELGVERGTVFEQTIAASSAANALVIESAALRYTVALDSAGAKCYFHRHCRERSIPSPDSMITVQVVVSDPSCSLDGLAIALGNDTKLAQPNGRWWDSPESIWTAKASVLAAGSYSAVTPSAIAAGGCVPGTEGRYSLSIPIYPFETGNGRSIIWEGILAIRAWDGERTVRWRHAPDGRTTFDPLEALNGAIGDSFRHDATLAGTNAITAAGALYHAVRKSLEPGRARDPALDEAKEQIEDGYDEIEGVREWFQDYLIRLDDCGMLHSASTVTFEELPDGCLVRSKVEAYFKARLKVLMGRAILADYLEPVPRAIDRGAGILLRAGATQREVAAALASSFGTPTGGTDPLQYWDAFTPVGGRTRDCEVVESAERIASALGAAGTIHAEKAAAAYALARIAATVPGSGVGESTACYLSSFALGGPPEFAFVALDRLTSGGDVLDLLYSVFDAIRKLTAIGAGGILYSIVTFVIDAILPDSARYYFWRFAMCVGSIAFSLFGAFELGALAAGATATLGGTIGIVILGGVMLFVGTTCILELLATKPDRPYVPPQVAPVSASKTGLGYVWTYAVETYADTLAYPSSFDPALARVAIDYRLTSEGAAFEVGACADYPAFRYFPKGIVFEARVERWTGTGLTLESVARVAEVGGVFHAGASLGYPWSFETGNGQIVMSYRGPIESGTRRITVEALANHVVGVYRVVGQSVAFDALGTTGGASFFAAVPSGLVVGEAGLARFDEGHFACPSLATWTGATVLRGVSARRIPSEVAEFPLRAVRTGPGTWQFDAPSAPRAPAGVTYSYYWDLSEVERDPRDEEYRAEAVVRTSPHDPVTATYPGAADEVQMWVVEDATTRLVAKGSLKPAPTTSTAFVVSREGDRYQLAATVRDSAMCVKAGFSSSKGPLLPVAGCNPSIRAEAIVSGPAKFYLDLTGEDPNGLRPSVTFRGQAMPRDALSTGRVSGEFVGGATESDVYDLRIPDGGGRLLLRITSPRGMTVVATRGADSVTMTVGESRLEEAFLEAGGGSSAGAWTVRVHSNGFVGQYTLTTELTPLTHSCDGYLDPTNLVRCIAGSMNPPTVLPSSTPVPVKPVSVKPESVRHAPDRSEWNWECGIPGPRACPQTRAKAAARSIAAYTLSPLLDSPLLEPRPAKLHFRHAGPRARDPFLPFDAGDAAADPGDARVLATCSGTEAGSARVVPLPEATLPRGMAWTATEIEFACPPSLADTRLDIQVLPPLGEDGSRWRVETPLAWTDN